MQPRGRRKVRINICWATRQVLLQSRDLLRKDGSREKGRHPEMLENSLHKKGLRRQVCSEPLQLALPSIDDDDVKSQRRHSISAHQWMPEMWSDLA